MKLLIAGGGTGGHVFPALAIAQEWLSRGKEREVVLVGTERGIEMKLVPQAGLPLETLRVAGLKGKGGATLARNLVMLGPAMIDARRVLRKHRPIAAFGVGGYAAGPMLLATWLSRVPNVIFEPNAEPGLTNKLLAKLSQRIATGYEISARAWGKKAIVTGCPVRPEFFSIAPRRLEKPFRLLVTGGSQGALPINRTFNAEVIPFLTNMAERFAWADVIVCRAGAITAAEIAAAGRAAIFIPFGAATDSHQLRNAQEMQRAGAGRLISEKELTAERVTGEIFSLIDQPEQIEKQSHAARSLARPDATRDIVNLIEEAANVQGIGQRTNP
jgi:UDP-N-acetylglucosamine--N-acetylmuramyl-(pentapeptide) pyrophosphoryl-undecaprenol N-acetylglucosamine transferase